MVYTTVIRFILAYKSFKSDNITLIVSLLTIVILP